jgi:RimJ/RimL family protein N-acetyltransferase
MLTAPEDLAELLFRTAPHLTYQGYNDGLPIYQKEMWMDRDVPMVNAPMIETKHLFLRPVATVDADVLRRISNEPAVRRYLWDDESVDSATIRDLIFQSTRMFSEADIGLFGVRRRGSENLIGFCGFVRLEGMKEPELAYELTQGAWGEGLATEASIACLCHAFEEAGLERVIAGADSENVASQRVIEKLGMRTIGRLNPNVPDASYYAVYRKEFLSRHRKEQGMGAEAKLEELGLNLPEPAITPPGLILPFSWVRVRGNRAYVSGHIPLNPDGSVAEPYGKVGVNVSEEEGYEAARLAGLSILGDLRRELGDLDRVVAWLRVFGMVNSGPGFVRQPNVINGFSDLILELYGSDTGDHARSAVGMAELPLGVPVEIEAEVEIRTDDREVN